MIETTIRFLERIRDVAVPFLMVAILAAGFLYKMPAYTKQDQTEQDYRRPHDKNKGKRIAFTIGVTALTGGLAGGLGPTWALVPGGVGGGFLGYGLSRAIWPKESDKEKKRSRLRQKNQRNNEMINDGQQNGGRYGNEMVK